MSGRTLSVGMAAAVALRYTSPGYLLRIDIDPYAAPPIAAYLCNRGTVIWDGVTYSSIGMLPPKYFGDANGVQSGNLTFQAVDQNMLAIALGYSLADRRVRIWVFDAGALGASDPVLDFDGVCDTVSYSGDTISMTIASQSSRTQFAPRMIISKENGFNWLPVKKKVIHWNGDVYELM